MRTFALTVAGVLAATSVVSAQMPPGGMQRQRDRMQQPQAGQQASPDRPQAERAIRDLASGAQRAWNAHDPRQLAGLWTEDGTVVNPMGREADGRQQVERLFRDEHVGPEAPMRESQTRMEVHRIHWLSADLAFVDVWQTVTNVRMGDQTMEMRLHTTVLARRIGDRWQIQHARAMQLLPPMEQEEPRGG
jgi:uncharacterized protein (TIGR02246 family)